MENIRAQRNDELDFVLAPKYIGIQAGRTSSRMTGIEDQNRKKKTKKTIFFAEINFRARIYSREKVIKFMLQKCSK